MNYYSADPAAYSFVTQLEQVLDDAEEIGLPYIGTASRPGQRYGETVDGYRRAAEDFNRFGAARGRGMRFYQHHHSEEFALENGTRLYDVCSRRPTPGSCSSSSRSSGPTSASRASPGFKPYSTRGACRSASRSSTSRTAWTSTARGTAAAPGPASFGWQMTDVGDGDIAFEPLFCGLDTDDHHYIVERDTAPDPVANPAGSFSTAERSYEYLTSLRARHGSRHHR